jgi:hypothetical protein
VLISYELSFQIRNVILTRICIALSFASFTPTLIHSPVIIRVNHLRMIHLIQNVQNPSPSQLSSFLTAQYLTTISMIANQQLCDFTSLFCKVNPSIAHRSIDPFCQSLDTRHKIPHHPLISWSIRTSNDSHETNNWQVSWNAFGRVDWHWFLWFHTFVQWTKCAIICQCLDFHSQVIQSVNKLRPDVKYWIMQFNHSLHSKIVCTRSDSIGWMFNQSKRF